MKNMKVSMKLFVSFLAVILLSVLVGVIGIIGMNMITNADTELYELNTVAVSAMGEIRESLQRQRVNLSNLALNVGNGDRIREAMSLIEETENIIDAAFLEYEATITDIALEEAYINAKAIYQNEYSDIKKRVYEASLRSSQEAYDIIFSPEVVTVTNAMVEGFATSMQNNDKWAKEQSDSNDALSIQLTVMEIIVLAIAVAIAMVLVFYVSGLINKPLTALTTFMKKAGATGDITFRQEDIEVIGKYSRSKDETGQCIASTANFLSHMADVEKALKAVADGDLTVDLKLLSENDSMGLAINKMLDNLNQMFSEINTASSQVSIGSGQVASGSQSLAQGSTEQASSAEELSASIGEISGKTKQNADMASEAAQLSASIRSNAEKGNEQMDNLMQAVTEINEASQNISKVIKVIDDIAFQTNILALNAAVEAARAGQHGKGFAVVADEVRNLAAKSAASAKDTSGMIENSIQKSNLGLSIATDTAASLKDIVDGINKSAVIVSQIAQSSSEQAAAISQINIGIDQVSQVIQQNSATAEESAAASEEMSGQATLLQELIKRFKIRDNVADLPVHTSRKQLAASSSITSANEGFGKY